MAEPEKWQSFLSALQTDILPIYAQHEQSFDHEQIHGRLHICRSLILAECMATLYAPFVEIDRFAIRYAVAFHDSGRRGNGVDIWEPASAVNCFKYLRDRCSLDPVQAESIARYIIKKGAPVDLNQQIANDADTLEIMRLTQLGGFKPMLLAFGRSIPELESLREPLIQEAWQFIQITELVKTRLSTENYWAETTALVQAYPLLVSGLPKESV
ncbi:MAG: hypothetical protein KME16_22045 [Scytolyngbya sp. HA4215-MV1]|jgi:hypothetical protein|nr:hypothetical protein [Scytolyngbya sp. HA4215-MV1]